MDWEGSGTGNVNIREELLHRSTVAISSFMAMEVPKIDLEVLEIKSDNPESNLVHKFQCHIIERYQDHILNFY